MITIEIICIGKLKERYWREAIQEYGKRLRGYCRFHITELGEERLPENPSPAQIKQCLEKEGEQLFSYLKGKKYYALCVEGTAISSEQFAERIQKEMNFGESWIGFVIGGSYGLSSKVKQAAALRLSFSSMTFPHQLMRVILCEQLYRVFSILNGGKYHK